MVDVHPLEDIDCIRMFCDIVIHQGMQACYKAIANSYCHHIKYKFGVLFLFNDTYHLYSEFSQKELEVPSTVSLCLNFNLNSLIKFKILVTRYDCNYLYVNYDMGSLFALLHVTIINTDLTCFQFMVSKHNSVSFCN